MLLFRKIADFKNILFSSFHSDELEVEENGDLVVNLEEGNLNQDNFIN